MGKGISGYRYIFPIVYKDSHIGSIAIGIPAKSILETLSNLDSSREYSFIIKKNAQRQKMFNEIKPLYSESVINKNFLHEDPNQILKSSPKKLSINAKIINKKLQNNKKLQSALKEGKTYGTFIDIDNTSYSVSFIPLHGLSGKLKAYLIAYKPDTHYPIDKEEFILSTIAILISLAILLLQFTTIKNNYKKMLKQKNLSDSINNTLAEGLYVMNKDAIIEYVNPMASHILGYTQKEMVGQNAHNLFHSHYINDHLPQKDCPIFKGVIENQEFFSSEEFFTCKDGKIISVDISSKSLEKDNETSQIVTVFRDISEKRKIEKDMLLLTKALEASSNTIVITDKDAIVQWTNPAFEKLTGYEVKDIIGKNPKEFINSGKHPKEFFENLWNTILDKKPWKEELINKRKDGSLYHEELSITPVLDENNEIQNFIAVKQDISERKKRENDVKHFAFYDALTDLPNRRLLIEHLEQIMNTLARVRKSVAVLFLDLDKFKSLNDTHGHDAGDDLLIQIANRLNNTVRKQDIVARIGGDEFIIVLDDLPADFHQAKEHTKAISEKIRNTIKTPFELQNITYETTTSIGICIFNDELLKIDAILKRADIALYNAKENGRDNTCFYREI